MLVQRRPIDGCREELLRGDAFDETAARATFFRHVVDADVVSLDDPGHLKYVSGRWRLLVKRELRR